MRVISGSARGLKLRAPKGMNTRPTTDRIKESLFNIIAFELPGASFLDVFSGSGGIGIEALSRGAKEAVFIDSDAESISIIKANVDAARLREKSEIIRSDVFSALTLLHSKKRKYDIIFMDPPYKKGIVEEVLSCLEKNDLLSENGFIIAEQEAEAPSLNFETLEVVRVKDYKTTKMTFLRKKKTEEK